MSSVTRLPAVYRLLLASAVLAPGAAAAQAAEPTAERLDSILVLGRRADLVGEAVSASEGRVGPEEIAGRPLLRTGDLMEFVPGLVATQHSGSGKANQYFLRGFNLDHGTDFATSVDAMPVNMRSHGHGQGYTDLNFLIPELVQELTYRKGTYYADVGDFSAAGSAQFQLADRLDAGRLDLGLGEHGYGRGVLADSLQAGGGDLLLGAELQRYDGPWDDVDEDVDKKNLMLRYSRDAGDGRTHVTVLGYDNTWNSPDQIPQRAVDAGLITDLGSLDTTLGGESSRQSVSGGWHGAALGGELRADAYLIDYDFALWSNFTYFLDDPVGGDQFQQFDERRITGFDLSQQWSGERSRWRVGVQGRRDDIERVGLSRSRNRVPTTPIRDDAVDETGFGIHAAHEFRFSPTWRSYLGWRYDRYDFDVTALQPENSGSADDGTASAKAALIWQPVDAVETYLSYGQGFHSNDARGTTLRVDPVSGEPASPVDPLVESEGYELGLRWFLSERLHATAALWHLDLDSELLFVGDAGNTEASRPSRRDGIELGMYWFGRDWLSAEVELSYTDTRFRDADPAGRDVPGSIPLVASAGLRADFADGWSASARVRHLGAYPLIEDDSVESDGSTLLNMRVMREWQRFALSLDILNLLDADDHDIDYYYASRLPGEADGGVEDIHFHVFEPRALRVTGRWSF
ncbi:TonB-dependent receptor [Chiayiivirga flava]|uniref:TonB-dependent receptor n=1 Tax=Chiayiivirga flava TaxID=659595 RepID=A0A7W8G1R8_9GAMM|nr:TonB-dependent receptor [Chiayiivirga flava]MBB5207935.1 hypothetical protein [Chiayiivirga flava]